MSNVVMVTIYLYNILAVGGNFTSIRGKYTTSYMKPNTLRIFARALLLTIRDT